MNNTWQMEVDDDDMLEPDEVLDALGALDYECEYLLHSEYTVELEDTLLSCFPVMVDYYLNAKEYEFVCLKYETIKGSNKFKFDDMDMDCINIKEEEEDIEDKKINPINCVENQFQRFVMELRRLMENEFIGTNGDHDKCSNGYQEDGISKVDEGGESREKVCDKTLKKRVLKQNGLIHNGEEPAISKKCQGQGKQSREKVCDKTLKKRVLKQNGLIHNGEEPAISKEYQRKQSKEKVCDKTLKKRVLKENGLIHTGDEPSTDKPFVCELCGKAFVHKFSLNRHKVVHTATNNKPFDCDMCGKVFKSLQAVEKHKRVHSSEKPFICELCGKAFARQTYLIRHLGVHSDDKPFSCEICMKNFKRKVELKRHNLVHTGDKPFPCEICVKRFKCNSDLTQHKKRAHSYKDVYINGTRSKEGTVGT